MCYKAGYILSKRSGTKREGRADEMALAGNKKMSECGINNSN